MSRYYDRQGRAITLLKWSARLENRLQDERRVVETTLDNGQWVSTVWLGLDHSFGSGPPLIFETMVFPDHQNLRELDSDRYSTEAEALAGHARLCEKWAREASDFKGDV